MIYAERAFRSATIINQDNSTQKLSRIPFMSGVYNELWLQELIAENPHILPSCEFGSDYSPLVCIGREVAVRSDEMRGYIDNLYITPSGQIVIVETKLFRNQESRRAVVAQIIEYAKEISKWDCERLNAVSSDYFYRTEGQACNLIDVMAKHGYLSYNEEAQFNDNINKCLSSASFLLLIVGDGIRSGVQQLSDFLTSNNSLPFKLGLIELEMYEFGEQIIIIPNLLSKTTIIERQISSVSYYEGKHGHKLYQRKPILSRREFISIFAGNCGYDPDAVTEFIGDIETIDGVTIALTPTELTIRFSPDGNSTYALITFAIPSGHSDIYIMPARIKAALEKHGVFPFEADEFLDFFKQYVNTARCKTPPYEYEQGFYYAHVGKVLENTKQFIASIEQFIHAIEHN